MRIEDCGFNAELGTGNLETRNAKLRMGTKTKDGRDEARPSIWMKNRLKPLSILPGLNLVGCGLFALEMCGGKRQGIKSGLPALNSAFRVSHGCGSSALEENTP